METKQNFETPHLQDKISNLEQELAFLRSQIVERQNQNPENSNQNHVAELTQNLSIQKQYLYEEKFIEPKKDIEQITLDLKPEEHDETMASLIEVVKKHGVIHAVDIVSKLQDAHINDDFHRFLNAYIEEGYPLYTKASEEELKEMVKSSGDYQFLFLGYKRTGRGANHLPVVNQNKIDLISIVKGMKKRNVSFDTLLIKEYQEELASFTKPILWTAEEGDFSIYIDAVAMKLARCSYADPEEYLEFSAYSLKDTIDKRYETINS
jgi:hypothetical protein